MNGTCEHCGEDVVFVEKDIVRGQESNHRKLVLVNGRAHIIMFGPAMERYAQMLQNVAVKDKEELGNGTEA